ncbi:dioxygenase family protein [Actinokineospora diospyrosa]|uniref:Aromatic ring-opening dioxygenase, catalytic subunit, LigB family n=1 Tax=Actinokineospora diospyrosa TaxID=103728 RepID=A0ABT1ICK0_9PSEU|nr:class III extradiol ring-cleavage dioxygenase [Actinokineospora diospyrosa]MCP2270365.1 Aromatic ring-opening dioxygenase, catalytic subunit, LigB family [Actinokineospora diospyrosa]
MTQPVLYLSHGAPPLADDGLWTGQLAAWSAELAKPTAILIVSAHWEAAPLTIGATETVPLTYDFWGFPERYYQVEYAAPGAPELAAKIRKLMPTPVAQDPGRGLDHGAYVPLVEMFPDADVPVLQISMPTLDPAALVAIGRRLAPLRDEGVLIIGSGFFTHNLTGLNMSRDPAHTPPAWSSEFDDWGDRAVAGHDIDALVDFERKAPAARLAHPRTEHFAPLFVALGATVDSPGERRAVIDGFWYGLSKRSWQFS